MSNPLTYFEVISLRFDFLIFGAQHLVIGPNTSFKQVVNEKGETCFKFFSTFPCGGVILVPFLGSVYFIVKTAIGVDTERKHPKAEKTLSNYILTERPKGRRKS